MRFDVISHPVLDCAEAKSLEEALFKGDQEAEWRAMLSAGQAVGRGVLTDWQELGSWPRTAHIAVLVGKGHNGGDALIAARTILEREPGASADVIFFFPEQTLRPLTARAWRELAQAFPARVQRRSLRDLRAGHFDVALDGVFGFQFRPPLDSQLANAFDLIEQSSIRLRAAVDLPSGLGDARSLRADFTYATGSVKRPLLADENRERVGRIRYLDIGFFDGERASETAGRRVLTPRILDALREWRSPTSDKRDYGHLFVVGGSRSFPGAVMMCVRAALNSGVGLLTAFVPESLVPAYAAHVPEAMWVGCPETPNGGIALEASHLIRERASRATALAVGPGLARERETLALVAEVLRSLELPAVLDADALQTDLVQLGSRPKIVTPHAGEFKRLAGTTDLLDYARATQLVTVLKGAPTRISDGVSEYISLAGGPVLARGGSGDMLAGMIGGLLAQEPTQPLGAACLGVVWHGAAADAWARDRGQTAVHSTELLDYLAPVLRATPPHE